MNKDGSEMPGPGNYEAHIQSQTGYSFTKEQRPGINSISPGPGAYDANDGVVKSASKKATIGQGQREGGIIMNKDGSEMPGPGNYEAHMQNQTGFSFTKEQRPGINSISPGPGAYDANDGVVKSGSKKATIGHGQREGGIIMNKDGSEMPGPGNYEAQ